MKKAVPLLVLLLVVVTCGPDENDKMCVISGKLLGYDGNPMILSMTTVPLVLIMAGTVM